MDFKMLSRSDKKTIRQILNPYGRKRTKYTRVFTVYKRKDKKVKPIDFRGTINVSLRGNPN